MEIWLDIKGCEGYYQVSNKGNVKSLERFSTRLNRWGQISNIKVSERIMASVSNNGYNTVVLSIDGVKYPRYVHRLVAEAFIPNPKNKGEVNHKNGIKNANNVENLEWVTPKENSQHAWDNGFNKSTENQKLHARKQGLLNGKLVINMETGVFYSSAKEAAISHNINVTTFHGYLSGVNKNKTPLKYV